ncbi:MAG TPA: cytochrome-c peroxidase, partial [Saprospiraceae bacterium]|nr:cytochrome-c peroxidase [Saprospiraceae bacterium]
MKIKFPLLFAALAGMTWFIACKADPETSALNLQPNLPDQPYDYALNVPGEFGNNISGGVQIVITAQGDTLLIPFEGGFGFGFGFNPQNPSITNAGATLGRVLFYDPQLSLNNRISCASCHKQELAFSDGKAGSTGFGGSVTPRNSMAILNAG